MSTANGVIKKLKKLGSPAKAGASARFFKTGRGQYGYGDVFLGVTVPEQRKIAKKYYEMSFGEIGKLLSQKIHECRLTALLMLVGKYQNANEAGQKRIAKFYILNAERVNNWDLVDSSAPYILGRYLLDKNKSSLYKFARSKNLWERRIAIIACLPFIQNKNYKDALNISKILLKDKHDLIHKAVGWMLREVGNRSLASEEQFLKKHASAMPGTMLRYAIEKLPKKKRGMYLALRRKN